MARHLAILGAGPKALALASKAFVLRSIGLKVPIVQIIEMNEVGAHWCGGYGYSDGLLRLCTNPEKDLGFPYRSEFGPEVAKAMYRFSWHAYLDRTGKLAEWIDMGRHLPTHRDWVEYLRWVAGECSAVVVTGRAERIEPDKDAWRITYLSGDHHKRHILNADGIVATGPGNPYKLPVQDEDYRICDGKSFWYPDTYGSFAQLGDARILIIGGGDTAATIVVELLKTASARRLKIDIMSRKGGLEKRVEGPGVDEYYSDPGDWATRSWLPRQRFLEKTDRGVVSRRALSIIGKAVKTGQVRIVSGDARSATVAGGRVAVDTGREILFYDRVVVAIGFNALGIERLFPKNHLPIRRSGTERQRLRRVAKRIAHDLSFEGLLPKLHLPMLAGLSQGPGFPNLTCLGLMADRILGTYVEKPISR